MTLTPAELRVLRLLARGLTCKQVARELGRSPATVKTQVEHIRGKSGAGSITGAVYALGVQDGARHAHGSQNAGRTGGCEGLRGLAERRPVKPADGADLGSLV